MIHLFKKIHDQIRQDNLAKNRLKLAKKEALSYLAIRQSNTHPAVKNIHKSTHFTKWVIKLLLPDFLVGHPNLWDNLKDLAKEPDFKPLRRAIIAWLIFCITIGSTGIYSLLNSPGASAANVS